MGCTIKDNKRRVIAKMTDIAQGYIKHYFADFTTYDIPAIWDTSKSIMYWMIRDSGTHLTDCREQIKDYAPYNDRLFMLDFENAEIKEMNIKDFQEWRF